MEAEKEQKIKKDKNYYLNQTLSQAGVGETYNPAYVNGDYQPFNYQAYTPTNPVSPIYDSDDEDYRLGDIDRLNERGDRDIEDARGDYQSTLEKWGNSLMNFGATTIATGVGGTAAILEGIGRVVGMMWSDDTWADATWNNYSNQWSEELIRKTNARYKNHAGKEYQDSSMWNKLGSSQFWATNFASFGYMVGMAVPGMGVTSIFNATGKALRAINFIDKAIKAGNGLGKTLQIIGGTVRTLGTSFIMAGSEAATESISNTKEMMEQDKLMAGRRYNEIFSDPNTTPEEKQKLYSEFMLAQKDIDDDTIKAGNFVFGANLAILTVSNMLEFGSTMLKGYGLDKKLVGDVISKDSNLSKIRTLFNKEQRNALFKEGKQFVTTTRTAALSKEAIARGIGAFAEGQEEAKQSAAVEVAKSLGTLWGTEYNKFNRSKFNDEGIELLSGFANGVWNPFVKSTAENMFGEEWWAGFFTGLVGMPGRGADGKINWDSNVIVGLFEANKSFNHSKELVQKANTLLQEDKTLRPSLEHLLRSYAAGNKQIEAILNDDKYLYKEAEFDKLMSLVTCLSEIGHLDVLDNIINNTKSFTDDQIQEYIDSTTDANGNGPFAINGDKKTVKEVRKELDKKAKDLEKQIRNFRDIRDNLKQNYPGLDDSTISKFIYTQMKLNDVNERRNSLSDSIWDSFKKYLVDQKIMNEGGELLNTIEAIKKSKVYNKEKKAYEDAEETVRRRVEDTYKGKDGKIYTIEDSTPTSFEEFMKLINTEKGTAVINKILEKGKASSEDIGKLQNSIVDYYKLLQMEFKLNNEYNGIIDNIKNNAKLEEKERSIWNKAKEKKAVKAVTDKLSKAVSIQEIRQILKDAKDERYPELKKKALEFLKDSKDNNLREAYEYITYEDKIKDTISKSSESDDKKEDALKLFDTMSNESSKLEDLANPENSRFSAENNIFAQIPEEGKNPNDPAIISKNNTRHAISKSMVQEAQKKVNSEEEYAKKFPECYSNFTPTNKPASSPTSTTTSGNNGTSIPAAAPQSPTGAVVENLGGQSEEETTTLNTQINASNAENLTSVAVPAEIIQPEGKTKEEIIAEINETLRILQQEKQKEAEEKRREIHEKIKKKEEEKSTLEIELEAAKKTAEEAKSKKEKKEAEKEAEKAQKKVNEKQKELNQLKEGRKEINALLQQDVNTILHDLEEKYGISFNFKELSEEDFYGYKDEKFGIDNSILKEVVEKSGLSLTDFLQKLHDFGNENSILTKEHNKYVDKENEIENLINEEIEKNSNFSSSEELVKLQQELEEVSKKRKAISQQIEDSMNEMLEFLGIENENGEGEKVLQNIYKNTYRYLYNIFYNQEEVKGIESNAVEITSKYLFINSSIPEGLIDARKQGKFIPFYDDNGTNSGFETLYKFLQNKGAFSSLNNGFLNVNDEIHFEIHNELETALDNDERVKQFHSEPVILMVASNGQIVGVLPANNQQHRYMGVPELRQRILDEYNKNKSDKPDAIFKYTSETVKVSKIFDGTLEYGDTFDSLQTLFKIDENGNIVTQEGNKNESKIGYVAGDGTIRIGDTIIENNHPELKNATKIKGGVMLLVPVGRKKYIPSYLKVARFNSDFLNGAGKDSMVVQSITSILSKLMLKNNRSSITTEEVRAKNSVEGQENIIFDNGAKNTVNDIINTLSNYLYIPSVKKKDKRLYKYSFVYYKTDHSEGIRILVHDFDSAGNYKLISDGSGGTTNVIKKIDLNFYEDGGKIEVSEEQFIEKAIKKISELGLSFNVTNVGKNDALLKEMMKSNVFSTNLKSLTPRNTGFVTQYIDKDGKPHNGIVEIQKQSPVVQPKGSSPVLKNRVVPVAFNGTEYYMKQDGLLYSKEGGESLVILEYSNLDPEEFELLNKVAYLANIYDLDNYEKNGNIIIYEGVYKDTEGRYIDLNEVEYITDPKDERIEKFEAKRQEKQKANTTPGKIAVDSVINFNNTANVQKGLYDYFINGRESLRVHTYLAGYDSKEYKPSSATELGNLVDEFNRDFFAVNVNDSNEIIQQNGNYVFPEKPANMEEAFYDALKSRLVQYADYFRTNNIKVYSQIINNGKKEGIKLNGNIRIEDIAGEVDLLGVDDKGNVFIIDFKTKNYKAQSSPDQFLQDMYKNTNYPLQLNVYAQLFQSMTGYPASSINLMIMPYNLTYEIVGELGFKNVNLLNNPDKGNTKDNLFITVENTAVKSGLEDTTKLVENLTKIFKGIMMSKLQGDLEHTTPLQVKDISYANDEGTLKYSLKIGLTGGYYAKITSTNTNAFVLVELFDKEGKSIGTIDSSKLNNSDLQSGFISKAMASSKLGYLYETNDENIAKSLIEQIKKDYRLTSTPQSNNSNTTNTTNTTNTGTSNNGSTNNTNMITKLDLKKNSFLVNVFNLDQTLQKFEDKVTIEFYSKPWKDGSGNTNVTARIYLKDKRKGYFELVKDKEDGMYSVHFKTSTENHKGSYLNSKGNKGTPIVSSKDERSLLFEVLKSLIPEGGKVSTYGELTQGGINKINEIGNDKAFKKVDERQVKDREDNDINIPIFEKSTPSIEEQTPQIANNESKQNNTPLSKEEEDDDIGFDDDDFTADTDVEDDEDINRLIDLSIKEIADISKELKWLEKVLPQLSEEDRIKIVNGLIEAKNGQRAWGQVNHGLMLLSSEMAPGTTYHEAFHIVTQYLLTEEQREQLYDEARKQWGNKNNKELEEILAEEFRKYVEYQEKLKEERKELENKPFLSRLIQKIFNYLKHLVDKRTELNSHIEELFKDINTGKFADMKINDYSHEFKQSNKPTHEINQRARNKLAKSPMVEHKDNPHFMRRLERIYTQGGSVFSQFDSSIRYLSMGYLKTNNVEFDESFNIVMRTLYNEKELQNIYERTVEFHNTANVDEMILQLAKDYQNYLNLGDSSSNLINSIFKSIEAKSNNWESIQPYNLSLVSNMEHTYSPKIESLYDKLGILKKDSYTAFNELSLEDRERLNKAGVTRELYENLNEEDQEYVIRCTF